MPRIVLVLVCVACVDHGCRMRIISVHMQGRSPADQGDSNEVDVVTNGSILWKHLQSHRRSPEPKLLKALATLFLLFNPAAGFHISGNARRPAKLRPFDNFQAALIQSNSPATAGSLNSGHTWARNVYGRAHSSLQATSMNFKDKHTSRSLNLHSMYDPIARDPLNRKAQIVATLGPASNTIEVLTKLIKAGVNVFRLNSSHRRPGQFEELIPNIRRIAKEMGRDVKILGDIQGPKFRCSMTHDDQPVLLKVGTEVTLTLASSDNDLTCPGRITLLPTAEQIALMSGLTQGMSLLLDDGLMEIKVTKRISNEEVVCEVIVGGNLKSRKGINVPQLQIDCSALTAKDREDAKFLLTVPGGVDYIALSFAQKAQDIQELIDLMDKQGIPAEQRPAIIPKIEKPAALKNIDEILSLSNGLMVARGDLGVELGLHRVPFAQKFLIRKANEAGKFCITATQMMESMISNSVPTRAEVSDVSNAVFDGTDAVMLSGESATGEHPPLVVEWMGKIIAEAEAHVDDISPSF